MADLEIEPFVRPPPPTYSFRLTGSIDRPAFIKNILDSQLILNPPSSLEDHLFCYNSTLSNLLNIHAPLITKQSLLTPITSGSPHTFKHLKPSAGTSSMYTSEASTPHLEPKPSPISNQPLMDTINLSLLPSRNTTLHSFIPALQTLDTSGEQSTLFFIANLPLHSPALVHLPLLLTDSVHFSRTKYHPFASHYIQSLLASQSSTVGSSFPLTPALPPSQSSLKIFSEAEVLLLLNSLPNK